MSPTPSGTAPRFGNRLTARLSEAALVQAVRDLPLRLRPGRSRSEHGEDIFIADTVFGGRASGVYVDIGASHPIRYSNTWLLYRAGWRGVTVEPIGRHAAAHRRLRPRDTQMQCLVTDRAGEERFFHLHPSVLSTTSEEDARRSLANGAILLRDEPLPCHPLREILDAAAPLGPVDFLSVDVEGADRAIAAQVAALPEADRPTCLCIEGNDRTAHRDLRALLSPLYPEARQFGRNLVVWRAHPA